MTLVDTILQGTILGLSTGFIYALLSLGLALNNGVMKIINYAHGEFIMLAMYVSYWLAMGYVIPGYRMEAILTPLITFPLFMAMGFATYEVFIKRIVAAPPQSQSAVTLGLAILLQNVVLALWTSITRALPYSIIMGTITIGPYVLPQSRLIASIISVVAIAAVQLFLLKTDFGIAMRATSDDRDAGALMGVNVPRIYSSSFGLGLALNAIAASLLITYHYAEPTVGAIYSLVAWATIAMAGSGAKLVGTTVASGLILGLVETIGVGLWMHRARNLILFTVFIAILWLRPQGLFAARRR